MALLAPRAVDEHPRVRLEAARALSGLGTPAAFAAAMAAVEKPTDRFLEYVLWLTAYEMRAAWVPEVEANRLALPPKALDFALQAVKSPLVAERLVEQVGAGWHSRETREQALAHLTSSADPAGLGKLFAKRFKDEWQPKVLHALARAARERGVKPQGDLGRVRDFLDSPDPEVREAALLLAGLWKLESLRPVIEEAANQGVRPAVAGLAALGGDKTAAFLRVLAAHEDPKRRVAGVAGLAEIDLAAAAALAPGALAADPAAVVEAFLARKGGAEALAKALDPKALSADAARLALRHMYAAGRQEPALSAVLNAALGLAPRRAELGPEALKALGAEALAKGDPARGEAVFRRRDLSCFQCHAIAGAGGNVGPDLLSLGASAPVDYIVESILRPEAKSKEGYVSVQVLTKDGDVLAGLRVRETPQELVLRDALRDELVLRKSAIEAQKTIGSVMPQGLADLLTDAELLDLVRFLSELGKPGPYAVSPAPVVRRWRVKQGGAWAPAYATVAGDLPADGWSEARGEIEVTTAGRFRLKLDAKDLAVTVDGKPLDGTEVELDRGVRAIGLVSKGRTAPVRLEIEEAPGSPGRLRAVVGK